MVDPFTVVSAYVTRKKLAALIKKDGAHAATVAYQHADPKDWALRLATAGFGQLRGPRPKRTLARALRKKNGTLRGRLNTAHTVGARTPQPDLIDAVDTALARSLRWRRLSAAQRTTRAAQVAGNMLSGLLEAYGASDAIAAADRASRRRDQRLHEALAELAARSQTLNDRVLAEHTSDRLAWLTQTLTRLPAVLETAFTTAFREDSEGVTEVLRALTDQEASPADTVTEIIIRPSALLGAGSHKQTLARQWTLLAETAAAYDRYGAASTGFQRAVEAGASSARMTALAVWAALRTEDIARAAALMDAADLLGNPRQIARVVGWWYALEANSAEPSGDPADVADTPAAASGAARDRAGLRAELRRQLGDWQPRPGIEVRVKADIGARMEFGDEDAAEGDRHVAARRVLEQALAVQWDDQTAMTLADLLVDTAEAGISDDRSADLANAYTLALRVRDARRVTGGHSAAAVRTAARAAGLALDPLRVIEVGSERYGQAWHSEAEEPNTIRYVVDAAARSNPKIAAEMERDFGRAAEDFTALWAHAHLAIRPTRVPELSPEEKIQLCRQVLAAAATPEQRLLAEHDLTMAGGTLDGDPPHGDPQDVYTTQMWARGALNAGDPILAISLLRPHRLQHPAVTPVLAEAYLALGKRDDAVEELLQAAKRFKYHDYCIYAAHLAAEGGDYAKAEAVLAEVLVDASSLWAQRAQALYDLGRMQGAREDWPRATESWQACLNHDPRQEMARWMLTQCHAARGDFQKAWDTITADPAVAATRREPPEPPTPLLARLLLMLTARALGRASALRLGLALLDRFGHDIEFRAAALSIMMIAQTVADGAPAAEADLPILENRLQGALGQFTAEHPDHPRLHVVPVDADTSGAELLELLARQCRATPLDAFRVKFAHVGIAQGLLPLGVLAVLIGLPYAEILISTPRDPLTARAEGEHGRSIADALCALGPSPIEQALASPPAAQPSGRLFIARQLATVPVVLDTTALWAMHALPELRPALIATLAELRIVDEVYLDLIAAADGTSRDEGMRVFADLDTGAPGLVHTPAAVQERQRADIAGLRDLAASMRRDTAPATTSPPLDDHPAGRGSPWLETMRLAAATGAMLWVDDVAVRAAARQCQIGAFSTSALLEALYQRAAITADQHEHAVRCLIRSYVGDFPPDSDRLLAMCRQDEQGLEAVLAAAAKPAFWSDHVVSERTLLGLLRYTRSDAPQYVTTLTYHAVLGIIRINAPLPAVYDRAVRLLATVFTDTRMIAHVPAALEAARTAMRSAPVPLPDPLEQVARAILREQAARYDIPRAVDVLRSCTALCTEEDKRTVGRTILSL